MDTALMTLACLGLGMVAFCGFMLVMDIITIAVDKASRRKK